MKDGTAPDREAKASYEFTAEVTDGEDADGAADDDPAADATIAVTVEVDNVEAPPGAPTGLATESAFGDDADVRVGGAGRRGSRARRTRRGVLRRCGPRCSTWAWETSWTLTGLSAKTDYRVQVPAVGDGPGAVARERDRRADDGEGAADSTACRPSTTASGRSPSRSSSARSPTGCRWRRSRTGRFEVGNGRVVDAKRSTPGENRRGTVRMRPASGEATTVTLNETTDCDAAGAICTTGGRALSNSATATVARPSVNAAATGAPTITGEAQAGETLTASTDGIEAADGLSGRRSRFQWVSSANGTDTDIAGATGSSYTLSDAAAGSTVKVRVTFTDDGGHEETLTSAATADGGGAAQRAGDGGARHLGRSACGRDADGVDHEREAGEPARRGVGRARADRGAVRRGGGRPGAALHAGPGARERLGAVPGARRSLSRRGRGGDG